MAWSEVYPRLSLWTGLLFLTGCATRPPVTPELVTEFAWAYSPDYTTLTFTIPLAGDYPAERILELVSFGPDTLPIPGLSDSAGSSLEQTLRDSLRKSPEPRYLFDGIYQSGGALLVKFRYNSGLVAGIVQAMTGPPQPRRELPVYPLFSISNRPPPAAAFQDLVLLLPCEGVPVPERSSRLPNAARTYRNGTHRGIDFFANWGHPVRAVAEGVVIRADRHFEEVPAEFREALLGKTRVLGRTPSDIFEHILLGKAIFIDHGFELVPGYRAVSIYAHLSSIDPSIRQGTRLQPGQPLGQVGNTGTSDSTRNQRSGAHLHWELILQDDSGEYYLGQGWTETDLQDGLRRIFASAPD